MHRQALNSAAVLTLVEAHAQRLTEKKRETDVFQQFYNELNIEEC